MEDQSAVHSVEPTITLKKDKHGLSSMQRRIEIPRFKLN